MFKSGLATAAFLLGVGDDRLHAPQAAPSQLAQELGPEGLGLRGADVHAERRRHFESIFLIAIAIAIVIVIVIDIVRR